MLGTTTRDALILLDRDPRTAAVALIGEIGGVMEEDGGRLRRRHDQAGRRLHRRRRRAARQADGPRRRDRDRRAAAATRPSAGRSRRPASRCWRRRPRSARRCGSVSTAAAAGRTLTMQLDDLLRTPGRADHQGLAGAGRRAAAARGRAAGLEPAAPGPAAAGGRAQGLRRSPTTAAGCGASSSASTCASARTARPRWRRSCSPASSPTAPGGSRSRPCSS